MAEVYLAYDEFLQREVAFKVLDRKEEAVALAPDEEDGGPSARAEPA